MKLVIAAAASAILAGCGTLGGPDATVLSASPTAVTVEFDAGELNAANKKADDLCASYGRSAQLAQVTPSGDDRVANYNCVYPS